MSNNNETYVIKGLTSTDLKMFEELQKILQFYGITLDEIFENLVFSALVLSESEPLRKAAMNFIYLTLQEKSKRESQAEAVTNDVILTYDELKRRTNND